MDLELRELRCFVAVAEELHFTRAAERLHFDQATISRYVRRLEQRVGVELLTRTTRTVALTHAGAVFLEKARETLATADAAIEAARRAAEGQAGTLRVGMMAQVANDVRTAAFSAFEQRFPGVLLRPTSFPFADPTCGLAAGATDVAFVWLPILHPAIETEPLFEEPRVFVLSSAHPLAKHDLLRLANVEEEPFFSLADSAGDPTASAWNDFWQLQPRPDGRRRPIGAEVANEEEWLDALARGRAISTTALSAATFYPWPGVAYVPAADLTPATVAIAWRRDRWSTLVDNFVSVVRDLVAAVPSVEARRVAECVA